MQKSLHIDPQKCTGCLQCEMACSLENEGVFNPAKSRIKVFTFHEQGLFAPYTCTQCDEAWCLHACPVEAMATVSANDAARPRRKLAHLDEDLCLGCGVCVAVCEREGISLRSREKRVITPLTGAHRHRHAPEGRAAQTDISTARLEQAADDVEQRRFSGPVGTDDRMPLSVANG